MMKTRQVLKGARDLLIRKGWVKGAFAVDSFGSITSYQSDRAVKFCAIGALNRVSMNISSTTHLEALTALQKAVSVLAPRLEPSDSLSLVVIWQDNLKRTKDEVLQVFDKAIEMSDD